MLTFFSNFAIMTQLNKHAYLIMAHSNNYVLEKLILLVDDERNDIFIHVDKKTKDFDFAYYQTLVKKSRMYFTDRIDVYWAHKSQIETELLLYKAASSVQKYSFYHLLSGADLPLKSQDEIHHFFEQHSQTQFIGITHYDYEKYKIHKIHLNRKYLRKKKSYTFAERLNRFYGRLFLSLQKMIGLNYNSSYKGEIRYGVNWASLTHEFVTYMLDQESWINKFFKYSLCGDEFYKQMLALNSSQFKNTLYNIGDHAKGSQRFIDWERGTPYTYRVDDFDLLMNSSYMFARKFDEQIDKEIVDLIYNKLKS